jgi:hypothetical protein
MSMTGKQTLLTVIATIVFFTASVCAEEDRSRNKHVISQKPYSSNQFPDNTVVIQTERHGRGTFSSYPSYQQRHRPGNQRHKSYRPSPHSRIYTSPQPSVSYYYTTPIGNSGYIQIQSRQEIYNNRQSTPYYHQRSPVTPNTYNVSPNNNITYFQQYRSQPNYAAPRYGQHEQHNVDRRPTSCLGPNCGN